MSRQAQPPTRASAPNPPATPIQLSSAGQRADSRAMAGTGSARSTTAMVGFFTAGSPGSTSAPIGVSAGPWAKAQSNIAAAGCQVPIGLAISDKRYVLPPRVAASTKVNLAATV